MTSSGAGLGVGDEARRPTADGRGDALFFRPLSGGPTRAAAVGLMERIYRPAALVAPWCDQGEVYALVDVATTADPEPKAAAVIIRPSDRTAHIPVVVALGPRCARLRRRLLGDLCDALRRTDTLQVSVAAARTDPSLLRLLQQSGFAFVVEHNGDVLTPDVVWLNLTL